MICDTCLPLMLANFISFTFCTCGRPQDKENPPSQKPSTTICKIA